jgi:hypothetical protein
MTARWRAWCDCSWHGEYDTEPKARYALRRHSCDRARRRAQAAVERARRRNERDRTVRPCTHKRAHHEHGTHTRYKLDGCRCDPCYEAAIEYERQRRRKVHYGYQAFVDARPAAEHLRALMAAGMGWRRVAAAANLEPSVVYPLLYGKVDRNGGRPRTKARARTVNAILAVPMPTLDELGGGTIVPNAGTVRRVQALATLGWSVKQIAARAGINHQAIYGALGGRDVVVSTARAVRDVYDQLWSTPAPEGDRWERIAATVARRRAEECGWLPPLAWDDDTIDDPKARPRVRRPKAVA